MPSGKDNILKLTQYMKIDKRPYIIYGNLECQIKKIDGCASNPKKSSTTTKKKKKQENIFLVNIQYKLLGHLIMQISIVCIAEKIV